MKSLLLILSRIFLVVKDLATDVIIIMLPFYLWDANAFIDNYFNKSAAFVKIAKIYSTVRISSSSISSMCLKCNKVTKNLLSLTCKHRYCVACWRFHITSYFKSVATRGDDDDDDSPLTCLFIDESRISSRCCRAPVNGRLVASVCTPDISKAYFDFILR